MILLIQQVRSEMGAYQTVFAVALIIIGAGLICVSLIWRRQAETEQPEPDDAGELRTFVDSLRGQTKRRRIFARELTVSVMRNLSSSTCRHPVVARWSRSWWPMTGRWKPRASWRWVSGR
jgi:hypothetical protein